MKLGIHISLILAATGFTALPHHGFAAVSAVFDAQKGLLFVHGDAGDNTIVVSTTRAGTIQINGGAVGIAGGPAYLKSTALICIQGGEGVDMIVWDDASANGDVDGRDFLVWQRGGSPVSSTDSSLDDYALWRGHYGTTACVLPEGEDLFIRTNEREYEFLMPIEMRDLTTKVGVSESK